MTGLVVPAMDIIDVPVESYKFKLLNEIVFSKVSTLLELQLQTPEPRLQ